MNKSQLIYVISKHSLEFRKILNKEEIGELIFGLIFLKYISDKLENYIPEKYKKIYKITKFNIDQEQEDEFNNQQVKTNIQNFKNKVIEKSGYFLSSNNLFSTLVCKNKNLENLDVLLVIKEFNQNISPNKKFVYANIFDKLDFVIKKIINVDGFESNSLSNLIQVINKVKFEKTDPCDFAKFACLYLFDFLKLDQNKINLGLLNAQYQISVLISKFMPLLFKQENQKIKVWEIFPNAAELSLLCNQELKNNVEAININHFISPDAQCSLNICKMLLIISGIYTNNIHQLDSEHLFSCVVSPDKFNIVVNNNFLWIKQLNDSMQNYSSADVLDKYYELLKNIIENLDQDGYAFLVIPNNILEDKSFISQSAKFLIDNNYLEAVISLSDNIFEISSIQNALLILNKNKQEQRVMFIDASKYFINQYDKIQLGPHDIKKIVHTYQNKIFEEYFSNIVHINTIQSNDYNLNPNLYVSQESLNPTKEIYKLLKQSLPQHEFEWHMQLFENVPFIKPQVYASLDKNIDRLFNEDFYESLLTPEQIKNFIDKFNKNKGFLNFKLDQEINALLNAKVKKLKLKLGDQKINTSRSYFEDYARINKEMSILLAHSRKNQEPIKDYQPKFLPFELAKDPEFRKYIDQIPELKEKMKNYDQVEKDFLASYDPKTLRGFTFDFETNFLKVDEDKLQKWLKELKELETNKK
ncbi:N-6 DNA methylase [Mycoplasmopsis ciconiae]|uniref:site-specific DNA-methyltransferase (adenine-specific) n=1 Tax=Mycoplasmopsis ciconiae TaxID=561067 RepID=A0ABU7ML38_9BACT|nr:N-6 DNA methylase [Mycoplasmopsis ciconiae]